MRGAQYHDRDLKGLFRFKLEETGRRVQTYLTNIWLFTFHLQEISTLHFYFYIL